MEVSISLLMPNVTTRRVLSWLRKCRKEVVCGNALYKLGQDPECEVSLENAVKNYQSSVDFYNEVRGSLKGKDNWRYAFAILIKKRTLLGYSPR